MIARLRSVALAASVVLATVAVPAATGGAVACAGEGPRAGLIVDTGSRVIVLCVALDAPEVSGLGLIELASAQHGLSYGFGMGGAAVCRLDGVGPAGNDCFAGYPEYWGYWHGDGRGGWTWASTGASSYRVGDGDMEGWVWATGDTGASHGKPPVLAFDDVCEPAPEPSPEPTRSPTPSPRPTASPKPAASPTADRTKSASTSSAVPSPAPESSDRPAKDRSREPSSSVSATPSPASSSSEPVVLALGAPPPDDGGPPAGLFLAGALALLLGAGGWLRLRARAKGAA